MATVLAQKELNFEEELLDLLRRKWHFLTHNMFRYSSRTGTPNLFIEIKTDGVAVWLKKQEGFKQLTACEVEYAIIQIFRDFEKRNPDINISLYLLPQTETLQIEVATHVVPIAARAI